VTVAGLKGEVTDPEAILSAARDSCGSDCSVQLMRSSMVFGRIHLESAADHAIRSFEQERNSSNSLATEALLYASGTRQIDGAIEKMGIRRGDSEIALVAFGEFDLTEFLEKMNFVQDDSVLEGDASMLSEFGITEKEIESVPGPKVFDIILERVALVDILK
jgi:tRNA threonylcarbamoyladenosine modification (KEOPS) complex Cgi121 subunit